MRSEYRTRCRCKKSIVPRRGDVINFTVSILACRHCGGCHLEPHAMSITSLIFPLSTGPPNRHISPSAGQGGAGAVRGERSSGGCSPMLKPTINLCQFAPDAVGSSSASDVLPPPPVARPNRLRRCHCHPRSSASVCACVMCSIGDMYCSRPPCPSTTSFVSGK